MKSNKRRKYLIEPKFQLAFIAYNVGVSFVISAVFYAAIRVFFWRLKSFGIEAGLPADNIFFAFVAEQINLMTGIFALTSAVIALILAIHGVFLSHKIAGPLYRLRQHMLEVARGHRMDEVHFRKKDYFKDLEGAYNEQLKTLKGTKKDDSVSKAA